MSKKLMFSMCVILVLACSARPVNATLTTLSPDDPNIYVSVSAGSSGTITGELKYGEWVTFTVSSNLKSEWKTRVDFNITKIFFKTQHDYGNLRKGATEPIFTSEDDYGCSYGPDYWQRLQLSGNSMLAGNYYDISINQAPFHNDVRQDLLVYAIPEPATIVLLGLGGLLLRRRRG